MKCAKDVTWKAVANVKGYKLDLPHLVQGCQRKDELPEVLVQVEVWVQGELVQSFAGNAMLTVDPEEQYSTKSQTKTEKCKLMKYVHQGKYSNSSRDYF